MRGIKPTDKQKEYIKTLYVNHYPFWIIAERTGIAVSTIKRYAAKGGWKRELKPNSNLDGILEDFKTIQILTATQILIKATHGEFDEDFSMLIDKAAQLAKVTEAYMKQAPFTNAKQSQEILDKVHLLLDEQENYDLEQKALIHEALYAIQEYFDTVAIQVGENLS